MQGIPGSGKSTMASVIQAETGGRIISTDEFWYTFAGERTTVYAFDINRLAEAHRWNQQHCIELMQADEPVIIVDNTNIKKRDAQIYIDLAAIFGYDVQVVSVQVTPEIAKARQMDRPVDRRIPDDVIIRMHETMERLI